MSQSNFNRRNFLKAGVLGATGAMMSKVVTAVDNTSDPLSPEKKEAKIVTRALGKTGIVLPVVSMGVMRADNPNLCKAALAKGIVHLDTAHGYQEGKNETMLGDFLKQYPRESFVISTKVSLSGVSRSGEITPELKASELTEKLDISLGRLGLKYVDIFYLHGASSRELVLNNVVLKELKEIKKSGKARFVGLSTHRNMNLVIDAAVESGVYDIVLTSYNYQMKNDKALEEAIARAAGAGLGIVGMKSMAGGFKDKERKLPVNTKAALKWVLQNENIHTTIPGFTSFEQLDESFSVMENLSLTEEDKKALFEEDLSVSLFCQGCSSCAGSCKKNLPVPDLMRAYMYTYGYRDFSKAQEVLFAFDDVVANVCSDCKVCTVTCAKGFNVAERITDVARLREVPREFFA